MLQGLGHDVLWEGMSLGQLYGTTVLNESLIHPSRLQSSLSTCTCPQKTDSGFKSALANWQSVVKEGRWEGNNEGGKEEENILSANFLGAGAKLQSSVIDHCCEQS